MAQQPRLTQSQEESLKAICAVGRDGLQRVATALMARGLTISRQKIQQLMIDELGDEPGQVLANFLFGVVIGAREDSLAPNHTLRRINDIIVADDEREIKFPGWDACLPALTDLLESRSIRLSEKALSVSYDFERVYQAGRFLTTVRPIYDDTRQEILGATIVQTLRLEFFSSSGESSNLSIALDRADIEELKRSCEDALRKADVAFQKVSGEWRLPTIMPGHEAP
jgi:hypothetical protein